MKQKQKEKQIRNKSKIGRIAPIAAALGLMCAALPAKAQEYTNAVVNNITNDMRLTWNWTNMYEFTVQPSFGGTTTGTTNGWYDEAANITQTANPDEHKIFKYWTGVPAGMESNNPISFSLNGPYTNVLANFDWDSHTLTVESANGSPTGTGTYKHGSSATSQVERVIDVAPGVKRRVTGYTLEDM